MNTAVRFALMYGAYFLAHGVRMAFWPIWLSARGLQPVELGLLFLGQQWMQTFGTPVAGYVADRFAVPRGTIVALALMSTAAVALFDLAYGFWPLFVLTVVWGTAWAPIVPLTDSQAVVGGAGSRFDYGRVRFWGSLTFMLATLLGGRALELFAVDGIYWTMLALVGGTALVSLAIPGGDAAASPRPTAGLGRMTLRLIASPPFLLFMVAAGSIQVSHAAYYGFGTLAWRKAGIGADMIGLLWAIGVVAEIALFLFGRRLVARLGVVPLLAIAAIVAAIRWTGTALTDDVYALLALQALHGITFGATHLATMQFMQRAVPPALIGSAQTAYYALPLSLGMGLALSLSGWLYQGYGDLVFLAMVPFGAISLVALAVLVRRWDGGIIPLGGN